MYRQLRANKYGANSTEYGGRRYHSKLEAGYAIELDLRKKAKDIADWEPQFKIELRANGKLICNYYCDFRVENNDGTYELVETKGYETDVYRFKRKLLEVLWLPEHLDHTYTVVKQSQGWGYRR